MNNGEKSQLHINPMTSKNFLHVLIVGLIVGVLTWVAYRLSDAYIFTPLFCTEVRPAHCTQSLTAATVAVSLLSATVALFALVYYRVSRPLLAVIAVTIALWGLVQNLIPITAMSALFMTTAMYGISYALFVWIMRIRHSGLVIVITVILLGGVRFMMLY